MPSLVSSNLSCLVVLRKAVKLESSARLQPGGYDGAQGTARPTEDRRDACPTTLFVKPIERTAEFISRTRFFGGGRKLWMVDLLLQANPACSHFFASSYWFAGLAEASPYFFCRSGVRSKASILVIPSPPRLIV